MYIHAHAYVCVQTFNNSLLALLLAILFILTKWAVAILWKFTLFCR